MSVPESERTKSKFLVLVKADELAVYTIKITNNPNIFLPAYRSALTDDIIRSAKNIFVHCFNANNIRVDNDREKMLSRRNLQEQAAQECNNLLALIRIAKPLFHLKSKRIAHWSNMILEVRSEIRSWRDSDKIRYKDIQ